MQHSGIMGAGSRGVAGGQQGGRQLIGEALIGAEHTQSRRRVSGIVRA